MTDSANVKVLFVGESPRAFALSQQRLENSGCRCHFASSEREVANLMLRERFDVVLGIQNHIGNTRRFSALLSGSRASLYCALPLEEGCLWLPIVRHGKTCFGSPALRPAEFATELDEIVEEIRLSAATLRAVAAA